MNRQFTDRVLAVVAMSCVGGCQSAQRSITSVDAGSESAAFIVRLGNDTISAERFTLTRGGVTGVVIDRSPSTTVMQYAFSFDDSHNIRHFEATMRSAKAPPTAAPMWRVTTDRVADGFDVLIQDEDSVTRKRIPGPPEAVTVLNRQLALYEIVLKRLGRAPGASLTIPTVDIDAGELHSASVARQDADTVVVRLMFPRGERVRADSTGRILGVSGLMTSYKWLTERVHDFDADSLARAFADRDVPGGGFGPLSSRDTARAELDGATIAIDYGRPSKRGRVIFGGLVPWGAVWRTGADLATHMTTDRELDIGGLIVPPGTYTLFTLPSPTEWQLIVNRTTGQSGLVYDASADVGRVKMSPSTLREPVERLTITIPRRPNAGASIRVAWDSLAAEVPLRVRR